MSIACSACSAVESSAQASRSYSVNSNESGCCGTVVSCWSRKIPASPSSDTSVSVSAKVAPAPSFCDQMSLSPRLMRCHAIRRDDFRDFNFVEALGSQVVVGRG